MVSALAHISLEVHISIVTLFDFETIEQSTAVFVCKANSIIAGKNFRKGYNFQLLETKSERFYFEHQRMYIILSSLLVPFCCCINSISDTESNPQFIVIPLAF